MTETVPPRIYTADEAAALLKCSARWLKDKARRREIPFTMPGGSYGWTPAHLAEIIRQFEKRPQAARSPRALSPARAETGSTGLKARTPKGKRRPPGAAPSAGQAESSAA